MGDGRMIRVCDGWSVPGKSMGAFPTTRWSLVIAARGNHHGARDALAALCEAYRAPVLGYLRRRMGVLTDAEDLVQDFFLEFIEHALYATADPARGRFRSLLLTQLIRFAGKSARAARALRRGGDQVHIGLDSPAVGHGLQDLGVTPEQAFEREWGAALYQRALARMRQEAHDAGKRELLRQLEPYLLESPEHDDYARIAAQVGMSRNTLAVTVGRLRQRLTALLRAEVAETVAQGSEVEPEWLAVRRFLPRS